MAKMVKVTRAGDVYSDEEDKKILINSENVNKIEDVEGDEVGKSVVVFNDGMRINVVETLDQLQKIINENRDRIPIP
jgi:tricorn protease-like protein